MAKGAGRKSTKVKGVKNAEAGAEGGVRGLPENDPIVVDNPNLRVDLLNVDGLPGGDPKKDRLLRKFKGMSQLVIFDSDGATEWRFIELEEDAPLRLILDGSGEHLIFEPDPDKKGHIQINTSQQSKFLQNDIIPNQFSLDVDPERRIKAFVCTGKDLATKEIYDGRKEVSLSDKGRHVVVLIAKPKRFGVMQVL